VRFECMECGHEQWTKTRSCFGCGARGTIEMKEYKPQIRASMKRRIEVLKGSKHFQDVGKKLEEEYNDSGH